MVKVHEGIYAQCSGKQLFLLVELNTPLHSIKKRVEKAVLEGYETRLNNHQSVISTNGFVTIPDSNICISIDVKKCEDIRR